jgi:spermidine synthase
LNPEIDPAVYRAASAHLGLANSTISSVHLTDGAAFVQELASSQRGVQNRESGEDALEQTSDQNTTIREGGFRQYSYVIQDCFTGGSVPGELFTSEFWKDLSELVVSDGIVAMVSVVGLPASQDEQS